jgi:hypothetical protein
MLRHVEGQLLLFQGPVLQLDLFSLTRQARGRAVDDERWRGWCRARQLQRGAAGAGTQSATAGHHPSSVCARGKLSSRTVIAAEVMMNGRSAAVINCNSS